MLRAAVLGSPVSHSLSPVLHRAGYRALGLTGWDYGRHELDAAGLAGFVAGLDGTWRGLSLTMPLKEVALAVADEVSALAARAGAANTFVRDVDGTGGTDATGGTGGAGGTGWRAENTDVAGLREALRPHLGGSPERALVLGAGATARSCVLALAELGVRTLTVRARDTARAADLLAWAMDSGTGVVSGSVAGLGPWVTTSDDVVVSTVPPAAAETVAGSVPAEHDGVFLDVVYADWPTPPARAAAAAGMTVVSGLEMLVHQAAEQFRLFTGMEPPVSAMRAAGLRALGVAS